MMSLTYADKRRNDPNGKPALSPLHGALYQSKIILYYLIRGIDLGYSFSLTSEEKKAHLFDDLVLRFKENSKENYILLQAKHKADELKKIYLKDLFRDKDYNLIKYFFAFHECIRQKQMFPEENLKNVIVCTNIDFDESSEELVQIMYEISDESKFLNFKDRNLTKNPKFYRFNKYAVQMMIGELEKYLQNSKDSVSKDYIGYRDELIDPNYIENDVKKFFKYFVFAVNQPSESELDEIIQKTINIKELHAIEQEFVYQILFDNILDWLKSHTTEAEKFLSQEDGRKMLDKAKNRLEVLYHINDIRLSESHFRNFNITFSEYTKKINGIIANTSYQLINLFNESNTDLNTIKVYNWVQTNQNSNPLRYLFVKIDPEDKLTRQICNFFEKHIDFLIIQCSTRSMEDLKMLSDELEKILQKDKNKKVVIISKHSELQSKKIQAINHNLLTNFEDLDEPSREFILSQKIVFQGSEVEVYRLLGSDKLETNESVLDKQMNIQATNHNLLSTFEDLDKPSKEFILSQKILLQGSEVDIQHIQRLLENGKPEANEPMLDILSEDMLVELAKNDTSIKIGRSIVDLGELKYNYIKRTLQISSDFTEYETPSTLMDIDEKIVLISSDAGMGKSSLITKLVDQSKKDDPYLWIVRIDLVNYCQDFDDWTKKSEHIVELNIIKFLCKAEITETQSNPNFLEHFHIERGRLQYKPPQNIRINPKTLFEIRLFVEFYNRNKLNLILDGFDEIMPTFETKGLEFASTLKTLKFERLWITTRAYAISTSLKELYNCKLFELSVISEVQQKDFLLRHFQTVLDEDEINRPIRLSRSEQLLKFDDFYEQIYDKKNIGWYHRYSLRLFMSIPLSLKMIADLLKEPFKIFFSATNGDENQMLYQIKEFVNIASLFDSFLLKSFDIGIQKGNPNLNNTVHLRSSKEDSYNVSIENHQALAVIDLWYYDEVMQDLLLTSKERRTKEKLISKAVHGKEKSGIVDKGMPPKNFRFVIRSYAEFLAASRIWELFYESESEEEFESIVKEILLKIGAHPQVAYFFVAIAQNHLTKNSEELKENIFQKLETLLLEVMKLCQFTLMLIYSSIIDTYLPLRREFSKNVTKMLKDITWDQQYVMLKFFLKKKLIHLAEAFLSIIDHHKQCKQYYQLKYIEDYDDIGRILFRLLDHIHPDTLNKLEKVKSLFYWRDSHEQTLYSYAVEFDSNHFRKLFINLNPQSEIPIDSGLWRNLIYVDSASERLSKACKLLKHMNREEILSKTMDLDFELRIVSSMQFYFFNMKNGHDDSWSIRDCSTIIKAFMYYLLNETSVLPLNKIHYYHKYQDCDITKCIQYLIKNSKMYCCKDKEYLQTAAEISRQTFEIYKFLADTIATNYESFKKNIFDYDKSTFRSSKRENRKGYEQFIEYLIFGNYNNCREFHRLNSYFFNIPERLLNHYDADQMEESFSCEETLQILELDSSVPWTLPYCFRRHAVQILVKIYTKSISIPCFNDCIEDWLRHMTIMQKNLEKAVLFLEELEKLYGDLYDAIDRNEFERTETLLLQHPDYIKSLINGKNDMSLNSGQNHKEHTLLKLAKTHKNQRIIELLQNQGAETEIEVFDLEFTKKEDT